MVPSACRLSKGIPIRRTEFSCWCDRQGMRNGMTLINHPLWFSVRKSLDSFPNFALSRSKVFSFDNAQPNGCDSKLTRRGKPQVLFHVSTQGNPFGYSGVLSHCQIAFKERPLSSSLLNEGSHGGNASAQRHHEHGGGVLLWQRHLRSP